MSGSFSAGGNVTPGPTFSAGGNVAEANIAASTTVLPPGSATYRLIDMQMQLTVLQQRLTDAGIA